MLTILIEINVITFRVDKTVSSGIDVSTGMTLFFSPSMHFYDSALSRLYLNNLWKLLSPRTAKIVT